MTGGGPWTCLLAVQLLHVPSLCVCVCDMYTSGDLEGLRDGLAFPASLIAVQML